MLKKRSIKERLRGSGILVVVLSAMAFSIYTMSTFSESEHFSILVNKYEKNNKEFYEKNLDNIEAYYENVKLKNVE